MVKPHKCAHQTREWSPSRASVTLISSSLPKTPINQTFASLRRRIRMHRKSPASWWSPSAPILLSIRWLRSLRLSISTRISATSHSVRLIPAKIVALKNWISNFPTGPSQAARETPALVIASSSPSFPSPSMRGKNLTIAWPSRWLAQRSPCTRPSASEWLQWFRTIPPRQL